jgi:putative ABC transport system substrate-binding protein
LVAIGAQYVPWEDTGDLERAIVAVGQKPNTGLIVIPTPHTVAQRELIILLATRHHLPVMYPFPFWVRAGGLISYGVDLIDLHRHAARYVDRILTGTRPGDLPVQLPTRFELAVNLKIAIALGLTLPPTLVGRADEVIE